MFAARQMRRNLLGELGEGQHHQVGRAQHRGGGDGPRHEGHLESQVLGDARGDGVKHRCGVHASVPGQDGPQLFPPLCRMHVAPFLRHNGIPLRQGSHQPMQVAPIMQKARG